MTHISPEFIHDLRQSLKPATAPEPRCELSDLPEDGCFHCSSGARNLGSDRSDMWADELGAGDE